MAAARSASNTCASCQQLGCMGRYRSPDCSLQTISVMNFDPWCLLPARNSCEKMPDIEKGRGTATTGPWPAQLAWWCVWSPRSPSRDRLAGEAAGTSQPAFLLPRTAIGGAWWKGEPDLDQQEWAPLTGTTSPLKGWRPSMFICTGNMPGAILPSVMLLCHLQGRATPSEAKPASEGTRRAIQ